MRKALESKMTAPKNSRTRTPHARIRTTRIRSQKLDHDEDGDSTDELKRAVDRPVTNRKQASTLIAAASTTMLAALAFAISFSALHDLALQAGVTIPALWPIVVDGLIVVATIAVVALRGSRWFAWTILIAASSVSLIGNAVHAYLSQPPVGTGIAIAVAVVPPAALVLSTHLAVALQRDSLSTDPKLNALRYLAEGKTVRSVAQLVGVSPSTVSRWKNEQPNTTPLHAA